MSDIKSILRSADESIEHNSAFGKLLSAQDREYLVNHGLVRPARPGTVLCHQNQRDNVLFIIINGEVVVSVKSQDKTTYLSSLHSGDLIGEISALSMMPRTATVTVSKPSLLLEIPGEVFSELLDRQQGLKEEVYKCIRSRVFKTALRAVPMFSQMSDESISQLCKFASIIEYEKDKLIIEENSKGRSLYVLISGVARVYTSTDGFEVNLALLRSGDHFGERAMLTGEARAASVASLTKLHLMRLDSRNLLSFCKKNEGLNYIMNLAMLDRQHKTDEIKQRPESKDEVQLILSEMKKILSS